MSFQAYLDNIQAKTGKTPEDFKALAAEKGLHEYRDLLAWLKSDYGLGQGHANAMAHVILETFEKNAELSLDEHIAKHFAGAKAVWRKPYDDLMEKVRGFGPDINLSTASTYISLLRKDKKFAILQTTAQRMDIGIKRKGVPPDGRFEASGNWNAMVTHRLKIDHPDQIDADVISWLRQAYESV